MRILIFGKNGQVGWELQRSLAPLGEIFAVGRNDSKVCGDLKNLDGIRDTIRTLKPNVVVNAAAYTDVNRAENEKYEANLINSTAVGVIAEETARIKSLLIHYSTDYVFDDNNMGWRSEKEHAEPLNTYGMTKLAGENEIRRKNSQHLIFRTSWVYATNGDNFIKKILHLADNNKEIKVISDQFGAPTGAEMIADCTAFALKSTLADDSKCGTYHLVASGETSWYEYAQFIVEQAKRIRKNLPLEYVHAILSDDYQAQAIRPHNSRMSNSKFCKEFELTLPDWKAGVSRVITEVLTG